MSETQSKTIFTIGGTGFFNSLFLVFLTLKLCKVIDWSWWWVSAPLWMPISIGLFLMVVSAIVIEFTRPRGY